MTAIGLDGLKDMADWTSGDQERGQEEGRVFHVLSAPNMAVRNALHNLARVDNS